MKKTKAKKILSLILVVAMTIGLLPQMAMPVFAASETAYSSGVSAGTSSAPVAYTISDEAQLATLATKVNSGTTYQYTTFVLQNDISLNAAWTPIGGTSYAFKGTFDGNNKKITQVKIGSSTTPESTLQYIGLFGNVDGGAIKNLGVDIAINSDYGSAYVGGLIGYSISTTITNCYATGSVTGGGAANVGGLLGYNQSDIITNCYATGSINGGGSAFVGGLVGGSSGATIKNCYATGGITGKKDAYVGGLVGWLKTTSIANCYATGNVVGGHTATVGGLLGYGESNPIKNCYATGDVIGGYSSAVGGFLGWVVGSSTITNAYWNSNANQSVNGIARTDAAKLGIGINTDSTTKMTSADMKDTAFVTTLNNNGSSISGASTWVPISEGYPTFYVPPIIITKPISIGTTAPVTGVAVADGTNTVPTGAIAPVITWSDDGTSYATASGSFAASTEYKTKYVYTASTGYEFDSTIAASDITVTNGGAVAVVLSNANKTLTITVTWPETASNACDITGFSFASPTVTGIITGTNIAVIVPYGTIITNLVPTIFISQKSTISPISGTGRDFTDPVIYTVTAEDGTKKEYTVTVTIAADPDIATVNDAKNAAENASYAEMNQTDAISEEAIKDALKSTATTAINDNGVTVTINKVNYTEAVAGTSADPVGTNGSYEFTITVSKGSQTQITEKKTITITATAFTGVSDVDAVAAAKTAIKDDTITVAFGADQIAKTAAVQSYVDGLLTGDAAGVTATVTFNSGTGEYDVVISKGSVEDSAIITMTITEDADPDIATVNNAKNAAESATYVDMNQAAAISEDAIKDALKSTATTAINDNGVTVTINKVSYTEPVAGTSANPAGTNGSYEFTIAVNKGSQTQITEKRTTTITATAFTGVSDMDAVAAAKTAIKDGTITVAFDAGQTAKTEAVQSYVNGLLTDAAAGVTATVTFNSETGNYDVSIEKGSVEDSTIITMTITEDADPDIATVNNAKNAAENASYVDMIQAVATDEVVIQDALKAIAESAVNNNTINVTVTKESYTAPTAGTSADPAGTNGSYVFKITVSKGTQIRFTSTKTIVIVATPYVEIPTYKIIGIVQDGSSSNVQDVAVKLMRGNNQVGLSVQTDADGKFTIENVVNGIYNLVVSKNGITVTTLVVVNNANNSLENAITLPSGKTNSVVEVKPSTPPIVVGGLDKQFQTTASETDKGVTSIDHDVVTNGGLVEIKFIAEKKDNTATNASDISVTATSDGKTVGIFVDLLVLKTVKDSNGDEISSQSAILTELPNLIEVLIPLDSSLQGKSSYVVYRYHGASVDTITTTAKDGEKVELIDNGTAIKLTVKKFSTYAIAYTTPSNPSNHHSSGSGTSSSVVTPTITAETSNDGKITISNDKKTATITPNDGYVIADVIVNGKSIGATEKYTFTDSNTHKITAVFVKKSALPYYNQENQKIYIGFSAIAGNLYKYVAPTGVTVEFKENPKNFTDNTIAWAKPSIDFVTEREIFLGTAQDQFDPNESMTRAMFVTAIGRLYERSYGSISENGSVSATTSFYDVNANGYYAKYVAWGNENGLIKGVGENLFAPNEKVTREQMAVVMLNFATYLKKTKVVDSSLTYADSTSISSWAIDGAKYCQETKVITGREGGSFIPQGNATRAEVAAVIERFIKTIVE
ncbi:GLUG motif-containing protein [Sinanaerobacter sp. ZZT-01]|uniref:GLUG motif-containing protein n=1 Tax=Sinanaerobacter sp. ZZT-01 TaxID=3111540 RepID=UPI002D77003F|nr:GLUG motif-containing protein [Sinanaerobacter sp. ZZT-01]WRR92934.1 GLUG motif-containing protein [Sinanaerobacter sp. ZZT-01]